MQLFVVLLLISWSSSAWAKGVTSRERVTCSIAAALKFRLPPELMLAVAEMEGGKPGQWVHNANGSHDVGPLQFNTKYLAHLQAQYGITAADVASSGCYPYELAAWRLRRHLDHDRGDTWTRAANYHSRAAAQNMKYRRKLIAKAASWQSWLGKNYAAVDENVPSVGRKRSPSSRRADVRPSRALETADETLDADETALLDQLADLSVASSRSNGTPQAGALEAAVQVPAHRAYRVLSANRAWGTAQAVDWLVAAFDALRAADGHAPAVQIHDMSFRTGGVMGHHRSHQSGRDVDITYFRRGCRRSCGQRTLKPNELDGARQWKLLSYWLKRDQLEFAFIDHALQGPVFEAAKNAGATPAELAGWFQYPRSAATRAGIIRHVPNHANHVHVRFRCARDDSGCFGRPSREEPHLNRSDSEAELLELLE